MGNLLNIVRFVFFLVVGLLILLVPHKKIKEIFPKAPSPAVVKVMGVIVLFCGIIIALMSSGL